VASHKQNLLPFSTPQFYALLSAESKATEVANNKKRLDKCHNNVWCHIILLSQSSRPIFHRDATGLHRGVLLPRRSAVRCDAWSTRCRLRSQ
jgi:hypothetical protein